VLAVQGRAVHATGTQNLPANGAVDRVDDVVLQTTLGLRVLHDGLVKSNWMLNTTLKITAKD
jgi:hypothetical protein